MKKEYKIGIVILVVIFLIIFSYILISNLVKKESNELLIENSNITLLENSTYIFKSFCTKNNCKINYKSSDENIFSVTEEGEIEAKSIGEGILTITSDKLERKVSVIVTNIDTMVTAINIKKESIELNKKDKYLLEIEIFPNKAVSDNLRWISSDNDVVTVSNGYIEAKNEGEAIITVSNLDSGLSDNIKVIVGKGATENIQSISFEEEIINISINESYQLMPIIRPINSKEKELTYEIDNEDIISIDNGLIKGKAKGETTITAIAKSGVSANITVKVEPSKDDLAINNDEIVIAMGETYQLRSNYIAGIEWYSSNDKVVTVSSSGLVKGINNGEAVITVVNSYGRMDTIKVTVRGSGIPVSQIILSKDSISLKPGGSYKVDATILPSNATNKNIMWETNDSRIATVNDDGTIMGLKSGETTVVGYASNFVQAVLKVTVSPNALAIDNLEISPSEMTLVKGDTYKLKAQLVPSNATSSKVEWYSSDDRIVSVDENGNITANKTGNALITAKINGLEAKASIEVKSSVIDIISVKINENDLTLKIGETRSIIATVLPDNATNKGLIWESSNNNVSVSNKGIVTALSEGTSTITVSSINGKKDTINVTVGKETEKPSGAVTEILLNLQNVGLHIGQTKQMKATILPLNAINNSVTWVSSNTNIVTVSSSGLLTGVNPGTAQVSAITENGKVAKATVTVTYPPIYDSGNKLLEMYSENLIVTMTQDDKTGIKIVRVWVANPYKQFHKIDSSKATGETVLSLLQTAVSERNLTNSMLIGGNAMFTNDSKRIGNLAITEGNVWLNNPGGPNGRDEARNPLIYAGINSSGYLNVYCTNPSSNCANSKTAASYEEPLFQTIINEGVRNTIVLPYECLFVYNGNAIDTSWDDRYAIRHTLCQVNTNNFVITLSTNGNKKSEHQSIQLRSKCMTGINLDGGGSANLFYKNRGSNNINEIRSTNRYRPDAIYFSEY